MSDVEKGAADPLEEVLARCRMAEPSGELDERVEALLQRRRLGWRALVVPVASFAAGVGVTCALFSLVFRPVAPVPVAPPPGPVAVAPVPQSQPATVVVAEPHQFTEELSGTLNGVPVRIRRIHTEMNVWPSRDSGNTAARVTLADVVMVDGVAHY